MKQIENYKGIIDSIVSERNSLEEKMYRENVSADFVHMTMNRIIELETKWIACERILIEYGYVYNAATKELFQVR